MYILRFDIFWPRHPIETVDVSKCIESHQGFSGRVVMVLELVKFGQTLLEFQHFFQSQPLI